MALIAQRPQPAAGDLWRFAVHDRLRNARFEEMRRVVEVTAATVTCHPPFRTASRFMSHRTRPGIDSDRN
jgi:hypothetical protein